jgi:hypothetical protein
VLAIRRPQTGDSCQTANVLPSLPGLRAGFPRFCEKRVALRRLSTLLSPFREKASRPQRLLRGQAPQPGTPRQAGLASVCRIRPRSIAMRPARVRAR